MNKRSLKQVFNRQKKKVEKYFSMTQFYFYNLKYHQTEFSSKKEGESQCVFLSYRKNMIRE